MGAWTVVLLVLAAWLVLSLAVAVLFAALVRWGDGRDRTTALTDTDEERASAPPARATTRVVRWVSTHTHHRGAAAGHAGRHR